MVDYRIVVMLGHGFHTSSNTDVDISIANLIGDSPDSLETTATLSVDGGNTAAFRQASVQCCHARNGSATTRCSDSTDLQIFNELWIQIARLDGTFQHSREKVFEECILEAALLRLG